MKKYSVSLDLVPKLTVYCHFAMCCLKEAFVFRKNLLCLIHSFTLNNKTALPSRPLVYFQQNARRHIQKRITFS